MPTEGRTFFVRKTADRWIVGRDGRSFVSYATKEQALELARRFMRNYPDAKLVIDDAPEQARLAARR